jgi:hypothetical protein
VSTNRHAITGGDSAARGAVSQPPDAFMTLVRWHAPATQLPPLHAVPSSSTRATHASIVTE